MLDPSLVEVNVTADRAGVDYCAIATASGEFVMAVTTTMKAIIRIVAVMALNPSPIFRRLFWLAVIWGLIVSFAARDLVNKVAFAAHELVHPPLEHRALDL